MTFCGTVAKNIPNLRNEAFSNPGQCIRKCLKVYGKKAGKQLNEMGDEKLIENGICRFLGARRYCSLTTIFIGTFFL